MVKHWDAIQAGAAAEDLLLLEAERLFFEALFVDPLERSALNGLGSILIFELELDAAEFFGNDGRLPCPRAAAAIAAAEGDLELLESGQAQAARPVIRALEPRRRSLVLARSFTGFRRATRAGKHVISQGNCGTDSTGHRRRQLCRTPFRLCCAEAGLRHSLPIGRLKVVRFPVRDESMSSDPLFPRPDALL